MLFSTTVFPQNKDLKIHTPVQIEMFSPLKSSIQQQHIQKKWLSQNHVDVFMYNVTSLFVTMIIVALQYAILISKLQISPF